MKMICVGVAVVFATASGIAAAQVVQINAPTNGTNACNAIKNQVNRAPNGTTYEFEPGARYRVDCSLTFSNRRNLTFNGNSSTIYTNVDFAGPHWQFRGGQNITMTGMRVEGSNENPVTGNRDIPGTQAGFSFRSVTGSTGVTVHDVSTFETEGDGLCLCHLEGRPANRPVHIYNYDFQRAGRHGILIVNARDAVIENGAISHANLNAFQVEGAGSGTGGVNIIFRNNEVGLAGRGFANFGGRAGSLNTNIDVTTNIAVGMDLYTRGVNTRPLPKRDISISGNMSDSPVRQRLANGQIINRVILFAETNGLTVTDNVQPLRSGLTPNDFFECRGCSNVTEARNIHP
jgi:hypothetical protein